MLVDEMFSIVAMVIDMYAATPETTHIACCFNHVLKVNRSSDLLWCNVSENSDSKDLFSSPLGRTTPTFSVAIQKLVSSLLHHKVHSKG